MDKKLKMLCNLYDRANGNIDADVLFKVCFLENLMEILEFISSYKRIKFMYLCAESVRHILLLDNRRLECLNVIKKIIEGKRVTNYECSELSLFKYENRYSIDLLIREAEFYRTGNFVSSFYVNNFVDCCVLFISKNKEEQKRKNLNILIQVLKEDDEGKT